MHQGFTWPAPWVVRHMMFRSPLIPIAMNQISLYILCPAPCNCNVPIPLIVSVAELSRERSLVTMRTNTIWKVLVFSLALQVAAMRMNAEAAISCSTVISDLVPCLSYVTGSAANPTGACCNGVKALNAAAQTTPDRQAACKCIKSAAASYKYNSGRAGKIPGLCGVNIGFPISASTNCNAIS